MSVVRLLRSPRLSRTPTFPAQRRYFFAHALGMLTGCVITFAGDNERVWLSLSTDLSYAC